MPSYSPSRSGSDSHRADREHLAGLVRAIGDMMRRRFRTVMAQHGLTPPQGMVLRHLGDRTCSMGDMADRMSVDASYVTSLADRLEDLGFVVREPSSSDRRVKRLVLTPAGERLRLAIEQSLVNASMFESMSDHEVVAVATVLEAMLEAEGSLQRGADPP